MRAVEITLWIIFVLTAPLVVSSMGWMPVTSTTCGTIDCQARTTLYSMASSFQLQEVNMGDSPGQMAWDVVVLSVTFPIYAFFWILYLLSTIVLIRPAMIAMFGVPTDLATYLNIGVVLIWMIAYAQWKRGGFGLGGYR